MRRRLLLRLYPARWRERYGDEFESVLDERSIGPTDVADVVQGAVDAHLRYHGRRAGTRGWGPTWLVRAWGSAAIGGGVLWATGLLGAMFDPTGRPWAMVTAFAGSDPWLPWGSIVLVFGTALLLVAFLGLGSFQAPGHGRSVSASLLLPLAGSVVSLVALVGLPWLGRHGQLADVDPFSIWTGGLLATTAGSAVFGVATWLTGAVSRVAAASLTVASVVMVSMWIGGIWAVTRDLMKASWYLGFFYLAVIGFGLGWVGLGLSAIRSTGRDRAPQIEGASLTSAS